MRIKQREKLADISLIGVSFLWGAGFIAVQYAIASGLSVSAIVSFRFIIGALVIFLFRPKSVLSINKREFWVGVSAGILLYLAFLAQTLGQALSTISNAAFITAIYVVLVPFIIWLFKGHPPKVKMFILVFTTLFGVLVLTYQKGQTLMSFSLGDILLLLCALGFAGHIAYLGTKAKGFNPINITFLQMATAGILGAIVFGVTDATAMTEVKWKTAIIAVSYLGVISSAVCYFLQTWAQMITAPSKAAIMMSAESLFGSLFSILIGLEAFRINIPIGGIIIFLSVIFSEIDFGKRKAQKQETRTQ